jgi:hypothetical protein
MYSDPSKISYMLFGHKDWNRNNGTLLYCGGSREDRKAAARANESRFLRFSTLDNPPTHRFGRNLYRERPEAKIPDNETADRAHPESKTEVPDNETAGAAFRAGPQQHRYREPKPKSPDSPMDIIAGAAAVFIEPI